MSDFKLPSDLSYNRGLVENPTAYAKERGAASWLFLIGDEFASMPGGISYADVQKAVPQTARVISDPPRVLTLELARQQVAALEALPRPTVITCRLGPRSSATAYLYAGLKLGVPYEEIIAAAEEENAPFCASDEYKEWVRLSLEVLREETV
ncbi:hypothetical protein [Armatimonas sp.]|uniref:hypothetical protein n=1 Tax=Armatimonas sp. TaxID=1872638 RepID=UPI00286C9AF3|nr:hypothetical protein [Armatimonas sp.]